MHPHTTLTPRQLVVAVAVVAAGGAIGTLLRDLALRIDATNWYGEMIGTSGWASRVPWILAIINVLGVYFATLALKGPLAHHDANNLMRLVVITGFFGGFTSYSTLYAALGSIWHVSVPGAFLTAFLAVLSGVAAAWLATKKWSSR